MNWWGAPMSSWMFLKIVGTSALPKWNTRCVRRE